jgi:hypothetical protein
VTELTPEAVLTAVAEAYRRFVEYEDVGFVSSGARCVVRFETKFVRDQLFHFAFSANPRGGDELRPVARLTFQGSGLEFWTIFENAPQPTSLPHAVAALTGISSGAAHGAAALLIAEVGGWLPTDLRMPVFLPPHVVAGRPCLHIRGKHPHGLGEHSLLVEEASYLIRGRITHGSTEHYTEYESCRAR